MNFRPYLMGDALHVNVRAEQCKENAMMNGRCAVYPSSDNRVHRAETAIDPQTGKIIACAGLMLLWPHYAHAWALFPSTGLKAAPLMRRCLSMIDRAAIDWDLGRIDAFVPLNFHAGRRFLSALGFAHVSWEFENYVGSVTYSMYQRVYD